MRLHTVTLAADEIRVTAWPAVSGAGHCGQTGCVAGADEEPGPPAATEGEVLADRLAGVPLPVLVVPLLVLATSAVIGNALAPALLANQPLLLLALNATTRHLVLTSTTVDVAPYVAVALVRRSLEDPLLYLLGWRYGDAAVAWTAEHLGGARSLGWIRRNFRRFGWVLVALFPGGVVCVMAGAARMGLVPFALVGFAGTVASIAAIRASGETLAAPVGVVVAAVGENWVWLTVLSVAMTAVWVVRRRQLRRRGQRAAGKEI